MKKALDIASAIESALENATVISSSRTRDVERQFESISTVQDRKCSRKGSCYRCSGNHLPSKCRFIGKECLYCKKKDHTIKVCRKRKDSLSRHVASNVINAADNVNSDDEHVSEDDIFNIYCHENVRKDKVAPFKFHAFNNSCSITFVIDTGASITIINEETMNLVKRTSAVNLVSSSSKSRTYLGELIKPLV